jgi:hypothetical protein
MAKIHTYKDARGMDWIIEQQSIPKKRGEYKFWIADTVDKKDTVKELTIGKILQSIKNKFG